MAPKPTRGDSSTASPAMIASAWSACEQMLQQLASPNSTSREWATVAEPVQCLEAMMGSTHAPAWPSQLLPRLCAAVARGLHPSLMGMSGPQPKAAVLYVARTRSNEGAMGQMLHLLCAVGELMQRLTDALVEMRDDAPQVLPAEADRAKLFTTKTGLLPAIGSAAGDLAAFLTAHKALKDNAGGDSSKEAISYCVTGLASGLLNLWVTIHSVLPEGTPYITGAPAISKTLQPIITLAVTFLQAFPGPAMPANLRPHPSGIPAERLTAGWAYKTQGLPEVASVSCILNEAICSEVWSRAVSNPGASLKPDTPRSALTLLQNSDTKYLCVFAALLGTASLHRARGGTACLDPMAFPTSSKNSGRSRREAQRRQQAAEQQQQTRAPAQQQQQEKESEVKAWHRELEAAMKIPGCTDVVLDAQGGSHNVGNIDALVGVHCCVGATLAARGEVKVGPISGRSESSVSRGAELLPEGLAESFIKTIVELLLMEADMQLVMFALQLLQGLTPSVTPSTGLIQPLVGGLCPYLVQGVRTADAGGGWRAIDRDVMGGPEHMRCGMLEAAGNLLRTMVDPRMAAGAQVQVMCDVVASQPTVIMSTMDAILRSNAVAEASNTIYYRRLQLYPSMAGAHVPELLRLGQQAVITCMSRFNGGDPIPNAATAAAVLDSPSSAGMAWVGLLLTAQKYALRALQKAPAVCAWDVAGAAVQQLLALEVVAGTAAEIPVIATSASQLSFVYPVVWTAAHDATEAAGHNALRRIMIAEGVIGRSSSGGSSDNSEDMDTEPGAGFNLLVTEDKLGETLSRGALMAKRLGPLLLPVVQLLCRSLLLLSKVLLLPAEVLSLGTAIHNPAIADFVQRTPAQLRGDAVVNAAFVATQLLEMLLLQLKQQDPAAAVAAQDAAAAASSSSSSSRGGARGVPAGAGLPAEVASTLHQQANACSFALHGISRALATKAKPPKGAQHLPGTTLLSESRKAFALKPSHSSSGDGGGSSSGADGSSSSSSGAEGGSVLVLLKVQQLAGDVLAQLPTSKMCANPNCTTLGGLSERELCEKRCSACKTSYCSKDCSRAHWKTHKPLCQRLAAAAAAAAVPAAAAPAGVGASS